MTWELYYEKKKPKQNIKLFLPKLFMVMVFLTAMETLTKVVPSHFTGPVFLRLVTCNLCVLEPWKQRAGSGKQVGNRKVLEVAMSSAVNYVGLVDRWDDIVQWLPDVPQWITLSSVAAAKDVSDNPEAL